MNSNYQVNKFYAQEKVNAHLIVAQAHRQAQKANGGNRWPGIARIATAKAVQIYRWAGRVISEAAQGLEKFGKANVSARNTHLY